VDGVCQELALALLILLPLEDSIVAEARLCRLKSTVVAEALLSRLSNAAALCPPAGCRGGGGGRRVQSALRHGQSGHAHGAGTAACAGSLRGPEGGGGGKG